MYSMRNVNVNKLFNMDDAHLYVALKTSSLYGNNNQFGAKEVNLILTVIFIFDFYLLLQ